MLEQQTHQNTHTAEAEGRGKLFCCLVSSELFIMDSKKPYFVAIFVQLAYAGLSLFSKAAFASGMNTYIFLFYRQAVGSLFLLPLTLFFKRKEAACLSPGGVCKIFMQASLGYTLAMNMFGLGVKYTSATLGAATYSCLPVVTFFFALIARIEEVKIRKASGMAKVGGIMMCIGGGAVLAFYKGPYVKPVFHFHLFATHHSHVFSNKKWLLGCFLLLVACISMGLWNILQAFVLKVCPSPLVLMCGQTLSSAIQSFVVAIAVERTPSEWKLGWNIRLLAVLFCGCIVTCMANLLDCWLVKKKGPVFQVVTSPLNLIFTLIGSEFLLNDGVNLGSIIGAVLLFLSLYSVLWGKSKEESNDDPDNNKRSRDSIPSENEIVDQI